MSQSSIPPQPTTLPVQIDRLPESLKSEARWVGWCWEYRDGQGGHHKGWTKPPLNPKTGFTAKNDAPETWGTYQEAVAFLDRSGPDGIGFNLLGMDNIVVHDLDGCRDTHTGEISAQAMNIVRLVGSYWELSPSGTGIRGICWGKKTGTRVEASKGGPVDGAQYDGSKGRYITLTGHLLPESTSDITDAHPGGIEAAYNLMFPPKAADPGPKAEPKPVDVDDTALLEKARKASNGDKFSALFDRGEITGYQSQSEADLALCSHLAFWCGGDTARIDQLFRQSALYRDKWDRADYRGGVLVKAVEGAKDFYSLPSYIPKMPTNGNGHSNGHGGPKGPVPPIDLTEDLPPAPRDFVLGCLYQQEYGDAQLLAYLYPHRLVYDHGIRQWFEWGGHFWKQDKTAKVRRIIAGQLAAQYLILSAELGKELEAAEEAAAGDDKAAEEKVKKLKNQIKQLRERATLLRQLRRIDRILDFAGSFLGIVGNEWDRRHGLLGCPNGVINLRTGVLAPGDPEDYIKSVCPTEWVSLDAPAARWEQFLQEILSEKTDVIDFLQEVFGYAVTGTVLHHILIVLYGPRGRNGKDTLLEVVAFVLGSAIASACAESVFVGKEGPSHPGGTRDDLYHLMGKRLVWGSESSDRAKINANTVKKITGGGHIVCRPPYGRQVSFMPTHTAMLLTNFEPQAPAGDDAFWERVKLISFLRRFVDQPKGADEHKQDPDLKHKLENEAPGILAWIVRGAMRWYERGRLVTPESVRVATQEYRDSQNEIAEFIEASCLMSGECSNTDIWGAYEAWADENKLRKEDRLGRKGLSQALKALDGVEQDRTSTRKWKGISLKDRVVI
jgi:putative DNA primase/helicase